MGRNYLQNICFEVHQAGNLLGVRIFLLPVAERNTHPVLQKLLEVLKRAQIPANSFTQLLTLLGEEEMPEDYKTLRALGFVLNTFNQVNIGEISYNRDIGWNITVVDALG